MLDPLGLASDVIAGGAALAGLILVYLGSLATSYASYEKTAQSAVRGKFQLRAWFAFIGIAFAISASLLALLGKWLSSVCAATASIVLLVLALIWGLASAFLTAKEVK